MPISEWIERLGRVIFEAPFGSAQLTKDAPELAEVRLAVFDEVKAKSHRAAGKDVFPYNLVRIRLRGIPQDQAAMFQTGLFSQFIEKELRESLAGANFRFPEDLQVEVETTPELPGPKERWLTVEPESRVVKPVRNAPVRRSAARLKVMKGTANEPEMPLSKARINIGRTTDVYRSDGPSRRNDLAFTEDTEINRTVSREHAHVFFDKRSGEYRLFNDRWYKAGGKTDSSCGLWIFRDGLSQEVHRSPRGVKLQAGDEIHLGRAVLLFMMK